MNQIEAVNLLIAGVVTAYKRQAYDMAEVGPLNEAIQILTQPAPEPTPTPSDPGKEEGSSNNPYANK